MSDVLQGGPERPPYRPPRWLLAVGGATVAAAVAVAAVGALPEGGTPDPVPSAAPVPAPAPARLYVSTCDATTVYRVAGDGLLSRLSGTPAGGGGASRSDCPDGYAFDAVGLVHVVDAEASRVRVVGEDGAVRRLDGSPADGRTSPGLRALLVSPEAVGLAPDGTLYVGDARTPRVLRLVDGRLVPLPAPPGPAPTPEEPARRAQVAVGEDLSAVFADSGTGRVLRVDPSGGVSTVAGGGTGGVDAPATAARLVDPRAVATGPGGLLWLSEGEGRRVRAVTPDGTLVAVAGTGADGSTGDGGSALDAAFRYPGDLAATRDGHLCVVDLRARAVRCLDPEGRVRTLGT